MRNKAFTLIELMIVVAIIAILAAMLIPAIDKARTATFYQQAVAGTITKKNEKKLKSKLAGNPKLVKELIKKYGPWENLYQKNQAKKVETVKVDSYDKKVLESEISKLKEKIVTLESSPPEKSLTVKKHSYSIQDKKTTYGWKYAITRNKIEVLVFDNKNTCEETITLLQESYQNGVAVTKENK